MDNIAEKYSAENYIKFMSEIKIEQIKEAIAKAERLESKLVNDATFEIGGFTSPKIRHLLNNLGAISTNYLEIGVHRGATFCAANYENDLHSLACDNWSEFNEDGNVKKDFNNACIKYLKFDKWGLVDVDCFTLEVDKWLSLTDFYLYDGAHDYESQKKAFTYMYPVLANECIVCVDDSDWEAVRTGTDDGIKECGFEILFHKHFYGNEGFHNGFDIFLLKKQQ